jgi:membrane protein required for colicin V production
MQFAVIDIIFAGLILLFTLRCALKGFVSELLSMAAVVLGLLAALYFFRKAGNIIRAKFMPEYEIIPRILAFIALFVIVFVLIKILEAMLKSIIEGIRLGSVDHFLGILFGLVEGFIVVSLVLFVLQVQPLFDPKSLLEKSFFAKIFLPLITGKGKEAAPNTALLFQYMRSAAGV